ncbi:hypothetical protein OUZ56_008790 [Daphnia magna]|uniref:Uncharacterized protein n=1 Tax=Daphnia magna TaxID=35525 RepID=A0ABR0AE30_9CRUS|nr:hypothetical protein OUZ56_008790 [Daphnia magna]
MGFYDEGSLARMNNWDGKNQRILINMLLIIKKGVGLLTSMLHNKHQLTAFGNIVAYGITTLF